MRAILVSLLLLVALPGPAAADLGHPDTPDVVVAAGSGGRSTWFPALERLRDGTLLAVYYDATSHTGPDGRIAITRSRDGGRTWRTPSVAIDTPLDDRDPSLVELADGTLLMTWFQTDWSTTPLPTPGGVWTARSRDKGRTWSTPARVWSRTHGNGQWTIPPVSYATPWIATSAKAVELPDRTLLLAVYGNTPDDARTSVIVLRSHDGGRTWPVEVAIHPYDNPLQEPAIALRGDGTVVMAIRSTTFGYWTSSRDGGRTWTPLTVSDRWEHASDLLPLRGGRLLHTWGDGSGPGRPTMGRVILADGTRLAPKVIYSRGNTDESYPSSVRIGPDRFLTIYYDAVHKIIGGTYSRLGEYLEP